MRRTAIWILLSVSLAVLLVSVGFAAAASLTPQPKLKAALKNETLNHAAPLLSPQTAAFVENLPESLPAHPSLNPTPNPTLPQTSKLPQNTATSHFQQSCESCHDFSQSCATCHHADAVQDHYKAECSLCHTPPVTQNPGANAWRLVRVSHTSRLMPDCQSCHLADAPPNHFQAQCSACHTPPPDEGGSWLPVSFDHSAASGADCRACHAANRPSNHFTGQCSTCHTTGSWKGAVFDHQGVTNCQNCHNPPRNHWGGECKQCHRIPNNGGLSWSKLNLRWHPFDLDHGGAGGNCSTCHTRRGVNCTSCHEAEEGEGGGDDD